MVEQEVYYYDSEGKVRIRGGDPHIEVNIYYDEGVRVSYTVEKADEDTLEEITQNMSKVRLTEKQKRSMPDKYFYNEETGRMNLRKLEDTMKKMKL